MDEEAKAAEGGFAFDSGDEVITQLDAFNGGPKDKFAGVEDKGFIGGDFDPLGKFFSGLADVNVGIAVVAEDAEEAVETDVEGGGLDSVFTNRVDNEATTGECFVDGTITENHWENSEAGVGRGVYRPRGLLGAAYIGGAARSSRDTWRGRVRLRVLIRSERDGELLGSCGGIKEGRGPVYEPLASSWKGGRSGCLRLVDVEDNEDDDGKVLFTRRDGGGSLCRCRFVGEAGLRRRVAARRL